MLLSANFKKAKMLTMFPLIKELGILLQKKIVVVTFVDSSIKTITLPKANSVKKKRK